MVEGFGGTMTRLTKFQADYIGVAEKGPLKWSPTITKCLIRP